ncbi:TPA: hypothetical protein ACSP24_002337, partial [Aeromonas veronii]
YGRTIGPDPRNFNQRASLGRNDLLIRTFLKRMRNLTVEENTILAEKELSLLERRLTTYKNLVELAVHLD